MLDKLNEYKHVTLEEIENFKLKNRYDTRFTLSREKAFDILDSISKDYSILEVEGDRVIGYESSYYDTKDFDFFYNHINNSNQKLNIRIRSYSTSLFSKIDIKKTKSGNRISKYMRRFSGKKSFEGFVNKHTPYNAFNLEEKVTVHFNRFTFINLAKREKITIDLDLGFTTLKSYESLPKLAIIEVKSDKFFYKSPFKKLLKKYKVKPSPINKYCLGISMMYENRDYLSIDFYNRFVTPSKFGNAG